jgi:HK97 family phage prohead protease
MNPFKSDPEKKVARDLDAARASRDALVKRLKAAELAATERKTAAQRLARDGADDATLDATEAELRRAQDRVTTLTAALAETEQQIVALASARDDAADKKLRAKTAATIRELADEIAVAASTFDSGAATLADASGRAAAIILDAKGLEVFTASVRAEVPAAVKMISQILRDRAAATLAGTAPAALPQAATMLMDGDQQDDPVKHSDLEHAKRSTVIQLATRLLDVSPISYNSEARTVDAVLSCGSPVTRFYGTEVLKISRDAVDLGRVFGAGVPVLDSHQQVGLNNALGRTTNAWINDGMLMGTLMFNDTPEGRKAEGMVARKEVSGISIGYRVTDWAISDSDGHVIDPAIDHMRWDENDLTFTASKWELLEISLCAVPADAAAGVRAYRDRAYPQTPAFIVDVRARMGARQRMHDRQQAMGGHFHWCR